MNPRDQPVREGRGDTSEQQRRFLAPTPRQPGARTGTYPSYRRGWTHSTPGPAPRTRSQLAAAASLASCELCAAEGALGAPSRSAWVPSLGEDGELQRPERYLWPSGAGVVRATRGSEARGSGPKLHGPRARLAGKPGMGRRRCSARLELRVPRAACALRAPWLRGEEATPARWRWRPWFAGLAQSRRWSRYLAALPWRARRAAALAASPRAARGEHSVRPRAPRCLSLSQHPPPPSLAAAARLRCSPASQGAKHGRPSARRGKADWTRRSCYRRRERPRRRPSGGELSTGTFSPAAGACVCDAVAPPARNSRLPSPPLPPASHPPPQHVYSSPKAHSPLRSSLPPVRLNYRPI